MVVEDIQLDKSLNFFLKKISGLILLEKKFKRK